MKTTIRFNFEQNDGAPYSGAIVKMYLDRSFTVDGRFISNKEVRDYSNSYGVVELDVEPSTADPSGENYYHLEIIYDRVYKTSVIVPESSEVLDYNDLEKYLLPFERPDFLGGSC